MSLETDGIWKAGVWNPSVWGSGVWFEKLSADEEIASFDLSIKRQVNSELAISRTKSHNLAIKRLNE